MKKITLLLLMCFMTSIVFSQVSIGNGDDGGAFESPPFNPYYGFSYGQSIYLASEINASGNITGFTLQLAAGSDTASADEMVDVWIGHTTKTAFSSTSDWVDVTTLTQVLTSGTLTSAADVLTFTFDAPFAYNGTDNLIIAVDANEPGFDGFGDRVLATDGPLPDMSLMYRSDSVNPDPLAPVAAQNVRDSRGNITFLGITQTCPSPSALTATNITTTTADLGWTQSGGNTNWDIEWGTQGFTPTGTPNVDDTSDNPYNLTSLTAGTLYDFFVRADCGMDNTSDTSPWVGPFTFSTLFNPPGNDECTAAVALTVNTDLSCGVVTSGTTAGATASSQTDDVTGTPDNDVWFSFVATGSEHQVRLLNVTAVLGTSTDMGMGVYDATGGCAGLVFVDDSDPNTLDLTGLNGGTTYFVRVYGWGDPGAQTNFDICVGTPPPPPGNDECDNAVALTVNADYACGIVTAGTTVAATASSQADDVTGTPDNDVWYSFVATGPAHRVSLLNVTAVVGTSTDMGMGVYDATGGCAGLVFVDDSDPNTLNLTGLNGGTSYFVRVYGWSSGPGAQANFDICVGTPPPPPANDDIAAAISINVDEGFCDGTNTNGTNENTTDSGEGAGACFNAAADDDVWFTFTVPTGTATVDVSTDFTGGTLVDSEIAVYSGTPGSLVELACSQDEGVTILSNGFSWNSLITDLAVSVGETYYVQVAGYNANVGTFCLDVSTNQLLSISEDEFNGFKYYPNPVKNTLYMNAQTPIESVRLYNILGQEVLNASPNTMNGELDMSSLETGTYFAKITINSVTNTVKVIKQ